MNITDLIYNVLYITFVTLFYFKVYENISILIVAD